MASSQTKDPSVTKIHAPPKVIEMNFLQILSPIQLVYLSLLQKILDLLSRCKNQGKCHPLCPKESNKDALVSSFSKSLSICFVVPQQSDIALTRMKVWPPNLRPQLKSLNAERFQNPKPKAPKHQNAKTLNLNKNLVNYC